MSLLDLDEFTQAFLEVALWASVDDDDDPLDSNYDFDDFAPDDLEFLKEECRTFQAKWGKLFTSEYCYHQGCSPVAYAGHDFWLTRVGSGCGYWEKSDWDARAGRILAAACEELGELNLYVGDEEVDGKKQVHCMETPASPPRPERPPGWRPARFIKLPERKP